MEPLTIAFVDSVPLTFGGGYEQFLMGLAPELARAGHDVTIVVPSTRLASLMYRLLSGRRLLKVLSDEEVCRRIDGVRLVAARGISAPRSLHGTEVIYVKNEPHELAFAGWLRLWTSARVVIGLHTSLPENAARSSLRGRVYWNSWYARLARRTAVAVHALQGDSGRYASECLGFPSEAIHVIPNGIATERFHPATTPEGPPFRVLFAGRLDEHKGIDILCEAVRRLNDGGSQLIITVAGEGPLRALVERSAAACPLLKVVGFVPDIADLYRCHHLVVVPSRREAQALAPAEALASGCALLTSDIPTNDVYREFGAKQFPSGDAGALAEGIHDLYMRWIEDPVGFSDASRGAAERAAALMGTGRTMPPLIDLLLRVAARNTPASRQGRERHGA